MLTNFLYLSYLSFFILLFRTSLKLLHVKVRGHLIILFLQEVLFLKFIEIGYLLFFLGAITSPTVTIKQFHASIQFQSMSFHYLGFS